MPGAIRKHIAKDGTISWRLRVEERDPVTGKRRQPHRTYATRKEAEAARAAWLVERDQRPRAVPLALVIAAGGVAAVLALLRWSDEHNLSLGQLIRAVDALAGEKE